MRGPIGLEQPAREPGCFKLCFWQHLIVRSEHDQFQVCQVRVGFDPAGQSQLVHLRHLPVQDRQVERLAGRGLLAQQAKGFRCVRDGVVGNAPKGQLVVENFTAGRVMIHHEDTGSRQVEGR